MANSNRQLNDPISLPARGLYFPDLQSRIASALPGSGSGRQARVDAAVTSAYEYADALIAGVTSGGYNLAGGLGVPQDGIVFSRASAGFYINKNGVRAQAMVDAARIQFDFAGNRLGLLYEPATTNFILSSQDITDPAWNRNNAGFSTATQLIENNANANHRALQTINFTTGQPYTLSVSGKSLGVGAKRYLYLELPSAAFGTTMSAKFDVATGAFTQVQAGTTATAYQDADGRWTCAIKATASASASASVVFGLSATNADNVISYLGDGVSGLDLIDFQLEQNAFPTSRIITLANGAGGGSTTADRAADVMLIDVARYGIGEGAKNIMFTFDDNSTQTRSLTVLLGQVTVPTDLNRRVIKRIDTA